MQLLERMGHARLNPMQEAAMSAGFLDEHRVVVSAPTASGKTLLALLAVADNYAKTGSKAVYVVPLRALASEKHEQFKALLEPQGLTVGLSTGELDSSSEQLHAFDVIVCTSEKMESLFRHNASWLPEVGLAVIDEVHLLGDGHRGATLEIVLTKLIEKQARLLCLSATIPNAGDIADWMGAKLVQSDYRPTPLELGVCDGESLYFEWGAERASSEEDLVRKALAEKNGKGQALAFVASRRNTEALARSVAPFVASRLTPEEKQSCEELADAALKALSQPTSQCRALAECLRNGVAFHHAGLVGKQRSAIERGFKRERCLKFIACTTTLAMGIDYPASWVIVRDLKRFNGSYSAFIPALEVAQMTGRAGRPAFDSKGTAVLCCKPQEKRGVVGKYVTGGLEDIWSQLSFKPLLRSHCLGLIASKHCDGFESLYSFFDKTFYAAQYGDREELFDTVTDVVRELAEMGFVREGKKLLATPVGKRVSELYIDPLTAHSFVEFVKRKPAEPFDYLLALNAATEARPLLRVNRAEETGLWEEMHASFEDELSGDDALERFKSAKLLNAWVNEATEGQIMEEFNLPPGVVHSRVRNMEWLAYALQELCFLLNLTREYAEAKKIRRRVKHGIKEELLELCSIRGVGRVRARRLWKAGVCSKEDYARLSKDEKRAILYAKGI